MATGAIEMGEGGSQAETLSCCGRNETIEFSDAVGIERLQRPSQRLIIEMIGGDPRGDKFGRSVYAGKTGGPGRGFD
jgi:hypothetical protein